MDKWTPELWLTSTQAELYDGTENITSPAAGALLAQAGLLPLSHSSQSASPPKILDNGTGMAQLVEVLLAEDTGANGKVEVVCGDVDASMLEAVSRKVEKNGWAGVDVEHIDTHDMKLPDGTFDYVFGNFVYMLMPKPIDALKESIRVLKPGGTLGFTTWSQSGPLQLLLKSISLIPGLPSPSPPSAPPPPPPISSSPLPPAFAQFKDPAFLTSTLTSLGMADVRIELFEFQQDANSPRDMASKMRPVVPIMIRSWPEEVRKEKAREVFERVEEVMRGEFGENRCWIKSTAVVVTAKKPN